MKTSLVALALALGIVGCSPQSGSTMPLTQGPISTAIAIPTAQPTATATLPPPSPSATPVPSVTPTIARVPAVQQHFSLANLPGAGRYPTAVVVLDNKVYATASGTDNVAVIQGDRVVEFIPVGDRPNAIAADPSSKRLYVANWGDKSISLIEKDQLVLTRPIGEGINSLLVFEGRLFAGSDSKGNILVLDPATLQVQSRLTMPNAFSIINLAADPVHHRIYANLYEKTAVIDSTSLRTLNIFPFESSYYTLLPDAANDQFLIAIYDSKSQSTFLVAVDPLTGAEKGRAKIGSDSRGAVLDAESGLAFVANSYSNSVSVVSVRSMTLVATVQVGLGPAAIALDEARRRLYVANYEGHNLSAVNMGTRKIETTIPLAMFPTALAPDEKRDRLYVANASTDSVYVVEHDKVIKEIPVGHHPVDLANDPDSNQLYVANRADGSLSIVNTLDFGVRSTPSLTRTLSTVAVDAPRSRVIANGIILDRNTTTPIGSLLVQGYTLYPPYAPDLVRTAPDEDLIYAVGWNGVPGSNSRQILYVLDANSLERRSAFGDGNVTAFAVDPDSRRAYWGESHPLAYTNRFVAVDSAGNKLASLPLAGRTAGMALNPSTGHIFLSQASGYAPSYGPTPIPADNQIVVLDTRSFGLVATLTVAAPGLITRLGNTIYAVSREDGSVTSIEDASMSVPPSPTPTITPTPWPTFTPTIRSGATPTRTFTRPSTPLSCAIPVPGLFQTRWTPAFQARTGCPKQPMRKIAFAIQAFEHGTMFWVGDEHLLFVLYSDGTFSTVDDTWTAGQPEDACPSVTVPSSFVKPKRGFGKVWCEQTSLRAKIGAAVSNEVGGGAGLFQRFAKGTLFGSSEDTFWFAYVDGRWE